MEQRFAYHRSVAPMLWVLVAIGCGELALVHLLTALLWSRRMAAVLSAISAAALLWLVAAILSMKRLPVTIAGDRVVLRAGLLKRVEFGAADVLRLRDRWNAADLKPRSVLKLSLVAYPNIVIDLAHPLPGRRGIRTVAHRLDAPAAFAAAIERLRPRHD